MSKLEKKPWGYEYLSDNGIAYDVGEVTAEYNVIIDHFEDICELFDGTVLIQDHLVDYVHGNLICGDWLDVKDFLDDRIDRYENHERTVRFYRDVQGAEDTLYKCYLGFEDEESECAVKIPTSTLLKFAREDR